MNKKGFTLVELISVIVLIALIMLLIVPSLTGLRNQNQNKQFLTYQDMMVEYALTIPLYNTKTHICLSDLNMSKINETMTCNGYVVVNGPNDLTPFLSCFQNGQNVYQTDGYSIPSDCR